MKSFIARAAIKPLSPAGEIPQDNSLDLWNSTVQQSLLQRQECSRSAPSIVAAASHVWLLSI